MFCIFGFIALWLKDEKADHPLSDPPVFETCCGARVASQQLPYPPNRCFQSIRMSGRMQKESKNDAHKVTFLLCAGISNKAH